MCVETVKAMMIFLRFSLSTLPGTKIRLKGVIPLICGFMLLESCHVDILGGRVEHLVLKWEANKVTVF